MPTPLETILVADPQPFRPTHPLSCLHGAKGDPEPAVAAFCNPNGYPSALQAEVLVTIQTESGVKVMSEAKLDHLSDDVDNFLESYGFSGES